LTATYNCARLTHAARVTGWRQMMHSDREEFENGSQTNLANVELVLRTVRTIDESGLRDTDCLLRDLLCAAWPTARARSQ